MKFFYLLLISGVFLNLKVAGEEFKPYSSWLVQPPTLQMPQESAVGGDVFANIQHGDWRKGIPALTWHFEVEQSKSLLLYQPPLIWGPGYGRGIFGLGFDFPLSLKRVNYDGEINFVTDKIESPFGVLSQNQDGFYYLEGQDRRLRAKVEPQTITIYDASRRTWTFKNQEPQQLNKIWRLVSVTDYNQQLTRFEWSKEELEDQAYLTSIIYGSISETFYRLRFSYKSIDPKTFYLNGYSWKLQKLVSEVSFEYLIDSANFVERWRYSFDYELQDFSGEHQLAKITRYFPSGQSRVVAKFQWRPLDIQVEEKLRPELKGLIDEITPNRFNSNHVSFIDINNDGYLDFETGYGYRQFFQTPEGFKEAESLPDLQPDNETYCRNPAPQSSNARWLRRVNGLHAPLMVLALDRYRDMPHKFLYVCNLDGSLYSKVKLPEEIMVLHRVRLVDMDRDGDLDLVYYHPFQPTVWPNIAEDGFRFGDPIVTYIPESTVGVAVDSYIVHDFNGDGYPDLISFSSNSLRVLYGVGGLKFETQRVKIFAEDFRGYPIRFKGLEAFPAHFNRDGLVDFFITGDGRGRVLINVGSNKLKEINVREHTFRPDGLGPIQLVDISGRQDGAFIHVKRASWVPYELRLFSWGAGLLDGFEDEWGVKTTYEWGYAEPIPMQAARSLVVRQIQRSSSFESQTVKLKFKDPIVSKRGKFLGFSKVEKKTNNHFVKEEFEHSSLTESHLKNEIRTAHKKPGQKIIQTWLYNHSGNPHSWILNHHNYEVIGESGQGLSSRTDYDYDNRYCLRSMKYQDSQGYLQNQRKIFHSDELVNFPHCLVNQIIETHQSDDQQTSSQKIIKIQRDSMGRMENFLVGGNQDQLSSLQSLKYDDLGRITSMIDDEGKDFRFGYHVSSQQPFKIFKPDGQVVSSSLSPVFGLVDSLHTVAGKRSHSEGVVFDEQSRVAGIWSSITESDQDNLNKAITYYEPSVNNVGRIEVVHKVLPDQSIKYGSFRSHGGSFLGSYIDFGEEKLLFDLHRKHVLYDEYKGIRDSVQSSPELWRELSQPSRAASLSSVIFQHKSFGSLGDYSSANLLEVGVRRKSSAETQIHPDGVYETNRVAADVNHTVVRDIRSNIIKYKDAKGYDLNFSYDMINRLHNIQMPDHSFYKINYDDIGRMQQVVKSDLGNVEYTWNESVNTLKSMRFVAKDQSLFEDKSYGYDDVGRINKLTYTDKQGSKKTYIFSYETDKKSDQFGLMTSEQGEGYRKDFYYRSDGKLLEQVLEVSNGWKLAITYKYNLRDDLVEQEAVLFDSETSKPRKLAIKYRMDKYGKLGWLDHNDQPLLSVLRNSVGEMRSVEAENGFVFDAIRDLETGRFQGYKVSGIGHDMHYQNALNDRGFIAREIYGQREFDSLDRDYEYDSRGFLTSQTGDKSKSWDYDSIGMPKIKSDMQRSFDGFRRPLLSNGYKLAWGPDGQLDQAYKAGQDIRYLYDASGQKLAKSLNGELQGLWFAGFYVEEGEIYFPLAVDTHIIGLLTSSSFLPLATNHVGSLITEPVLMDPWGSLDSKDRDLYRVLYYAHAGFDAHTGFVRFGVRDYDPRRRQFIAPDRLFWAYPVLCVESPVECNLFSYAKNNPLKFRDPDGYSAMSMLLGEYRGAVDKLDAKLAGFFGDNYQRTGGSYQPGLVYKAGQAFTKVSVIAAMELHPMGLGYKILIGNPYEENRSLSLSEKGIEVSNFIGPKIIGSIGRALGEASKLFEVYSDRFSIAHNLNVFSDVGSQALIVSANTMEGYNNISGVTQAYDKLFRDDNDLKYKNHYNLNLKYNSVWRD